MAGTQGQSHHSVGSLGLEMPKAGWSTLLRPWRNSPSFDHDDPAERWLLPTLSRLSRAHTSVAVVYEIVGGGGGDGGAVATSANAVSFGEEVLFPETLAFLAEREIPVTGVGLGGESCDRIGIPSYQIKLATAKVLGGGDLGLPEKNLDRISVDDVELHCALQIPV
ncbi:hypothetical protein SELMODRAFT_413503 [Selaginella moellendorffii]|uniref:Uncharacterized protein n=1 Tax=Selaginella moellendorffii TaxID=88036 RepID=D8RPP5_SELML|nr:hypothetical protein SELMODRAFT_413503 [Selaginella moellendorffii]